jgi:membrane-bound metal-dependent hydrolase YbcI (DUF457 family)
LPITPFHFGVGAAFHAADPRRVSFLSFCLVNCVIDCETVWNFLRGAYPLHRFLHTFLGATLVAVAVPCAFLLARRLASKLEMPNPFGWRDLTVTAVMIGAFLGTTTHVVLDGIMHPDVRPFWPWNESNPFYSLVSLGTLHLACLVAAALGVGLILWRERSDP